MMWRLKELPVYSSAPTAVDATHFNLIRRTVMKSREPIRIHLHNMGHIDMIIDEDSWTCVDSSNNDLPIVAWIEFKTENRSALHTPIKCLKNYYHFAAGKVAADALKITAQYLTEHYAPAPACEIRITKKKKVWKTATAAELSCV